ncbi:hypothetical protein ACFU6S_39715 [Streptomyces sp. NPDC057456]|uniref:hypothetical protein n=1 Tax=Streptomyces sp. NPDC057456 TaxID=3346139 RepID=UPI0036982E5B
MAFSIAAAGPRIVAAAEERTLYRRIETGPASGLRDRVQATILAYESGLIRPRGAPAD